MSVVLIESRYETGNLIFYEAAIGPATIGNVLKLETTAVTVGSSTNSIDLNLNGYLTLKITDTDSATEAQLWYDASDHKLKYFNGTSVKTVAEA